MVRVKVFISGPIQGMEGEQGYRERLRKILVEYGYEVVDPWERERVVYSVGGGEWWRNVPIVGFIRRDLEDIEGCDVFVAYLPRLSAGTCMELFYARRCGKRTVVICELENPSPWIVHHSDVLLKSIKELEDHLKRKRVSFKIKKILKT